MVLVYGRQLVSRVYIFTASMGEVEEQLSQAADLLSTYVKLCVSV